MTRGTLLHVDSLRLVADGDVLLDGASFDVGPGESRALLGTNATATSTLLSTLAGSRPPADGVVRKAPGSRVAYLGPDDALDPAGTIAQCLTRALEPVQALERQLRAEERGWTTDRAGLERHAELYTAFERMGGYRAEADLERDLAGFGLADVDRDRPVATLSGGQRRRLLLALAWTPAPDLLLLDEPTTHLDLDGRAYLAERLGSSSAAWIVASHDRVLIHAASTGVLEITTGRLRSAHRWTSRTHEVREANARARAELTRGPALMARHLTAEIGGHRLIDDVGLRVEPGERVAITGANGSGKSTLLAMLAAERASDDPRAARFYAPGVKLWWSDQHRRGLDPAATPLDQLERWVFRERARQLLGWAGVPRAAWARSTASLSSADRARTSLALAVAREANLWILDEPEAHLDLRGIERLEDTLLGATATVVFASHDRTLVDRVADRVLRLEDGRLREEPHADQVSTAATDAGSAAAPAEPEDRGPDVGAQRERLEDERAEIEEALLDPLRLTDRERTRMERRLRAVIDGLSELYDLQYPAPRPRVSVREDGIAFGADVSGDVLDLEGPPGATCRVTRLGAVGHVVLRADDGNELLRWARIAWIRAATRLAFYLLGVDAVQTFSSENLEGAGLVAAGQGWWVVDRARFEASERWVRSPDEAPR